MAEQKGYDEVTYNSGYEKNERKRDGRIRGWGDMDECCYPPSKKEDGGEFIERNNVRDRI